MKEKSRRIFYRCVDWNKTRATYWLWGFESHLLQMRGLKRDFCYTFVLFERRIFYRCVDWNHCASRWICHRKVASFTDAWIETLHLLKRLWKRKVASFTDAWIETPYFGCVLYYRGRIFYRCVDWNISKLDNSVLIDVASFTDAWIETPKAPATPVAGGVASFTDAWIETGQYAKEDQYPSRIFYRCVDWNPEENGTLSDENCRIFYRCVDWNSEKGAESRKRIKVASFTDAWIETDGERSYVFISSGRIFYRCVDWNLLLPAIRIL